MSEEEFKLEAQPRDRVGKGAARELRRNSMVPAVIYGDKKPPLSIALPLKEITMKVYAGGFFTQLMSIEVDGETHKVLPKDYQMHPVSDRVIHVDLLRVSRRTMVTVDIPVHFINEDVCPGLKVGGTLNIVRHTIEVDCRADAIPESFVVDLAESEIDDVIHVSAITIPDGVELGIDDRDFTICTIQPPKVEEEPEEVEEAPETEITGQKSEEGDDEGGEGEAE